MTSAVIRSFSVEYEQPAARRACDTRHAWARVPPEPAPAERAALKDAHPPPAAASAMR